MHSSLVSNLVLPDVAGSNHQTLFIDRTSLTKDPNAHDSQVHTHLAHAIVRFLELTSPQELAEYGVFSAADLVDLVSRVRDFYSFI